MNEEDTNSFNEDDNYAQYLLEQAEHESATLHEFTVSYNSESDQMHFFFEGEDDGLFYLPEARRLIGNRQIHVYICYGKRKVKLIRDRINSGSYDINKCVFFVDRDYDDYLNSQISIDINTYITDFYSIENYICNFKILEIILGEIIKLPKSDPDFSRIIEQYKTRAKEFERCMLALSAWIISAKEIGLKPNLNNTNGLRDVVKIIDGKIGVESEGFKFFKSKILKSGQNNNFLRTLSWARNLDIKDSHLWIRGKYYIWFFRYIIIFLLKEANARRKLAGMKSIKIPDSINSGNLFEILGGRLPPPVSLQHFLQNKLG